MAKYTPTKYDKFKFVSKRNKSFHRKLVLINKSIINISKFQNHIDFRTQVNELLQFIGVTQNQFLFKEFRSIILFWCLSLEDIHIREPFKISKLR